MSYSVQVDGKLIKANVSYAAALQACIEYVPLGGYVILTQGKHIVMAWKDNVEIMMNDKPIRPL